VLSQSGLGGLDLIGNPRVAVLDEMTTGLDPQARRDTWQLIEHVRDRGVTIILMTHYMATVHHTGPPGVLAPPMES